MSNHHIGDTNKMVDTPRTDAAKKIVLGGVGGDWEVVHIAFSRQLERELNAANGRIELLMSANADVARIAGERDAAEKRIKRLEAELEQTKQDRNAIAKNTREPLLLQLDHANDRIKRLEEAVDAYRTAYTPDGHVAPHDCFATGPKTGNPIEDLVACPGCWAERKAKEAKL